MKRICTALFISLIISGCNKEKLFDGPHFYEDDFESYTSLENLLLPDDQLWSYTQITRQGNAIQVDSTRSHSGNQSLKFTAEKSEDDIVSKTSIAKQKMAFWEGETVRLTAWYYIEGTEELDWLFLMDLEEQTAIGAGPGMRLALVDNKLRVEYKFFEDDITQNTGTEYAFPRDQWVELSWEIKLSRKQKGSVKLWQNGQLIIDSKNNVTLPKDILYFQQGTKGMYSSCEIGVTANSFDNAIQLWVDDIVFETIE